MALEELGAFRSGAESDVKEDDFLLRWGLDLLAAFRRLESDTARRAVLQMIAAISEAEKEASSKR